MAKTKSAQTKRTLTIIGLITAVIVLGVVTYISLNGGIFETRSKAGTRNAATLAQWNFARNLQSWKVVGAKSKIQNGHLVVYDIATTATSSSTSLTRNYRMSIHPNNVLSITLTYTPNHLRQLFALDKPLTSAGATKTKEEIQNEVASIDPRIDWLPVEPYPITTISPNKPTPTPTPINPTQNLLVNARYYADKKGNYVDLGTQTLTLPTTKPGTNPQIRTQWINSYLQMQTLSFNFPSTIKKFSANGQIVFIVTSVGGAPNSISIDNITLTRKVDITPTKPVAKPSIPVWNDARPTVVITGKGVDQPVPPATQ